MDFSRDARKNPFRVAKRIFLEYYIYLIFFLFRRTEKFLEVIQDSYAFHQKCFLAWNLQKAY